MYMIKEESLELEIMEGIFSKPNSISEGIKEAIFEMNIVREKRVSNEILYDFIEKYRNEKE